MNIWPLLSYIYINLILMYLYGNYKSLIIGSRDGAHSINKKDNLDLHQFCLTLLSLWVLLNRSWKCGNAEFQYKMYLKNLSSKCIYIFSGMGFPPANFRARLKLIWCEEQYFLNNKEKCYLYKSGRSGDISRTNTVWGLFRRRRWRKMYPYYWRRKRVFLENVTLERGGWRFSISISREMGHRGYSLSWEGASSYSTLGLLT